jgi:hypothetical protein
VNVESRRPEPEPTSPPLGEERTVESAPHDSWNRDLLDQAIADLRSGADLTDEQNVLLTASLSKEEVQLLVRPFAATPKVDDIATEIFENGPTRARRDTSAIRHD